MPGTPTTPLTAASPHRGGAKASPFLRDAPPPDLSLALLAGASPRGPLTPLPAGGGSGALSPAGGSGAGGGVPGLPPLPPPFGAAYEDPPIWQEIFRWVLDCICCRGLYLCVCMCVCVGGYEDPPIWQEIFRCVNMGAPGCILCVV